MPLESLDGLYGCGIDTIRHGQVVGRVVAKMETGPLLCKACLALCIDDVGVESFHHEYLACGFYSQQVARVIQCGAQEKDHGAVEERFRVDHAGEHVVIGFGEFLELCHRLGELGNLCSPAPSNRRQKIGADEHRTALNQLSGYPFGGILNRWNISTQDFLLGLHGGNSVLDLGAGVGDQTETVNCCQQEAEGESDRCPGLPFVFKDP